ncbi:hypothetical protein F4860DRAFT_518769 [Xylaria cubensis]|nr:hypothetical protein F4860DRAFT_518769 [Xylaria cubensis]
MTFLIQLPSIDSMKENIGEIPQTIYHWLSQPHILATAIAWLVTFTAVCSSILRLGFGSHGVGPRTYAAGFQSKKYGGTTPARGIFATLTRMAMTGTYTPMAVISAALIATIVAFNVWGYGVGR